MFSGTIRDATRGYIGGVSGASVTWLIGYVFIEAKKVLTNKHGYRSQEPKSLRDIARESLCISARTLHDSETGDRQERCAPRRVYN